MIAPCKCPHAAQDEMHGKGMRVHTQSKDGVARCTVCGPDRSLVRRLKAHANNWLPAHTPNKK